MVPSDDNDTEYPDRSLGASPSISDPIWSIGVEADTTPLPISVKAAPTRR